MERGAADIGVAGKDILLEYEPNVYELLDLKTGVCRMAVAAKENFRDDTAHAEGGHEVFQYRQEILPVAWDGHRYYSSERLHRNCTDLGLSDVIVDHCGNGYNR